MLQVDGRVTSGPDLSIEVNGLKLPNPFVIGSGAHQLLLGVDGTAPFCTRQSTLQSCCWLLPLRLPYTQSSSCVHRAARHQLRSHEEGF
jgi:hypothetical protein